MESNINLALPWIIYLNIKLTYRYPQDTPPRSYRVKQDLVHEAFHFISGRGEDSTTVIKVNQNLHTLKENLKVQQAHI